MAGLTDGARSFIRRYEHDREHYLDWAHRLEELVRFIVQNASIQVHLVSARPKMVDSLRAKLLDKRYEAPENAVTDLLGVRVITYYDDAVDVIVDCLKHEFLIDQAGLNA